MASLEDYSGDKEIALGLIEIVREFAIKRKLIVYGGLAIDYALKLKGSGIYEEGKLPDIDMYSSDSVKDAYDLVDIFVQKGYKNVQAHRGIHFQTMRVRVDFISCADISYIPAPIYDKMPTLNYNNMRILHPHYQLMDFHLSFSFPLTGMPNENIFNRWEKDLKRYNLIMEHYPMAIGAEMQKIKLGSKVVQLPKHSFDKYAFNGFAAFNAICTIFNQSVDLLKSDLPKHEFTLAIEDQKIRYDLPKELMSTDKLVLVSPFDIEYDIKDEFLAAGEEITVEHRNAYMDIIPEHTICGDMIIYSTRHHLVGISVVKINEEIINIASPHYLMLYFLGHYYKTGLDIYLSYYKMLYAIIMDSCKLFKDYKDLFIDSPWE